MRNLVITKSITDRNNLSIQKYFADIQSIKALTTEEEFEIATKAFNGDEKARELLVKHNLRFAISVAKQYYRKGTNLEDLINEGNIGLMKAAAKFDPTRGFKFITYAVYLIRVQILNYIQEHSKTIRIPHTKYTKGLKMNREYATLEQKLERAPCYNDMVDYFKKDYTESEVDYYISSLNSGTVSLDEPLSDESNSSTLLDIIKHNGESNINEMMRSNDSEIRTEMLLKKLNEEERTILILLYGLNGDEPVSIKEITNMLGFTKARVALIRDKALRKLKYQITHKAKWVNN